MDPKRTIKQLEKSRDRLSGILPRICSTLFKLQQEGTTEEGRKMIRRDSDTVQIYGSAIGKLIEVAIDHVRENRIDLFKDDQEKMQQWQNEVKSYKLHDEFWAICKEISAVASDIIKIKCSSVKN